MAIDRTIWDGTFNINQFPTLPCPTCKRGRVAFDKSTLHQEEPKYSSLGRSHEHWEPDWQVGRFSARLYCFEPECGEVVIISGDTPFIEISDEEFGWGYTSVLRPRSMYPAPPIIGFPDEMPHKVQDKINTAFGLYWYDTGASANSLRQSLEFLLDHLKVSDKSTSNKTGKIIDLDLNGRIQFYEKASPAHARTLQALRMVGNLGSHGTTVTSEALLDAFELYEDALAEIIGGRRAYLDGLRDKIAATKGKY